MFLFIWTLMWGNWIKRVKPASRIPTIAYATIVPGALFYLNLPSLLLAKRQNDLVEVGRLHIAMVLWGTVALAALIGTGIAIFVAYRQIGRTPRQKLQGPTGITA
jgi:hypothetical protein